MIWSTHSIQNPRLILTYESTDWHADDSDFPVRIHLNSNWMRISNAIMLHLHHWTSLCRRLLLMGVCLKQIRSNVIFLQSLHKERSCWIGENKNSNGIESMKFGLFSIEYFLQLQTLQWTEHRIPSNMFARMNPNQRVWAGVGGLIVTGTVFKVRY